MKEQAFVIRTKELRSNAAKAVMQITAEPLCEVVIRRHKKRRTLPQNDKWHAMLNDLANFTGQDAYEIKGYVKGLMGIKHSSDVDKMPFADLIERTYALGADIGFVWPSEENQ